MAPRKRHALRWSTLLLGALAGGCTSYQLAVREPPPRLAVEPPPPGVGRICVLRPHQVASLVPAVVRDNGRLVGMTRGPSYFCYLAAPGMHRIETFYGDDIDATLDTGVTEEASTVVLPGQSQFLHHDVRGLVTLSVRWVAPEQAREMMGECDYADLVEVPGDERLPAPGAVVPALPR